MIRVLFVLATCLGGSVAICQHYDPSCIFAHNDYERAVPFHTAYDLGVGYIEVDVFLRNKGLLVAHHEHEIESGKTIENLYLKPLAKLVRQNGRYPYKDHGQSLTLMIDIKTEAGTTLQAIVDVLQKFPELLASENLDFMISGNVPDPAHWIRYPSFIHFDGRPGIDYTPEQWSRIRMISTSFGNHVQWDGKGDLPVDARNKISTLVNTVHKKGKKFRFWGTPDVENAWKEFMSIGMDVILTDNVEALAAFIQRDKN